MSTAKRLYAGKVTCLPIQGHQFLLVYVFLCLLNLLLQHGLSIQKEKGVFQHSSFLAGGATIAAGRFTAENGIIMVQLRNQSLLNCNHSVIVFLLYCICYSLYLPPTKRFVVIQELLVHGLIHCAWFFKVFSLFSMGSHQ
jgi:hypothetical protein